MILPTNDSISGTLSIDDLFAMTSVAASSSFTSDRMWLNGEEEDIASNSRLVHCLQQIRSKSASCNLMPKDVHVHIVSRNNFPTAAGLASSAAGYACLVYALGHLFGITDQTDLCILARMGSGSAIRSIFGGFVRWITGTDSSTSIARQVVDQDHWPDMRVLILVVNDVKKDVSSTAGMKRTVETSEYFKDRISRVVPQRIQEMETAIKNRSLASFLELTMRDSNSFHSVCLDSYPPIKYMNETSFEVVKFVHAFNDFCLKTSFGSIQAGYTFDAGPNPSIFLSDLSLPLFYTCVNEYFPPLDKNVRGQPPPDLVPIPSDLKSALESAGVKKLPASLKYLINTKIGPGPLVCEEGESLIDSKTGTPK